MLRCDSRYVRQSTGVGVLDKSVAILEAVHRGRSTLAELSAETGVNRATAHRLATALQAHGFLARTRDGRWVIGPAPARLAGSAVDPLLEASPGVLAALRDVTGESAQLYRRSGDERVCVAAAERASGLRDTVPLGARLPMTAGSAAQVLLAWDGADLHGAVFSARTLADVRRQGWAHSVGEREAGVASVSAPVRDGEGRVVAAVSVSGPAERLGRQRAAEVAGHVVAAAGRLAAAL